MAEAMLTVSLIVAVCALWWWLRRTRIRHKEALGPEDDNYEHKIPLPFDHGSLLYSIQRGSEVLLPQLTDVQEDGLRGRALFHGAEIFDRFSQDPSDGNILVVMRSWRVTRSGSWRLRLNWFPPLQARENKQIRCLIHFIQCVEDWTVPSVLYDGNQQGSGKFPRGQWTDGWAFREDRTPIPGCSILRSAAMDCWCACEPACREGEIGSVQTMRGCCGQPCLRFHVPSVETPQAYREKGILLGGLAASRGTFFRLDYSDLPFVYSRRFFLCCSRHPPAPPCNGLPPPTTLYTTMFGWAWQRLRPALVRFDSCRWDFFASAKLNHVLFLLKRGREHNVQGLKMGHGNGLLQGFYNFTAGSFVVKSLEAAVIFALAGRELKRADLLEAAVKIGDWFLAGALPNGLHHDMVNLKTKQWGAYLGAGNQPRTGANTRCNGEVMLNYLKLTQLLPVTHASRAAFLALVRNNAEFYISHQLESGSFGRWWSKEGVSLDATGTNGAHVILMLLSLDSMDGPTPARTQALARACRHYVSLAEEGAFFGDTLDADSMDKEAGVALLEACLALYAWRRDATVLRAAVQCAAFVLTWMWTWNVPWPTGSPCHSARTETRGLTGVSVAHHHLDLYGMTIAHAFLRLARATGDNQWEVYALGLIRASRQLLCTPEQSLGRCGREYFGWQPEQINHTDWDYRHHWLGGKGTFHTCIAWNAVLVLGALLRLREDFPLAVGRFAFDETLVRELPI